jgi:hypothetical protein
VGSFLEIAAKATLSFLPGSLPGQLGTGGSRKADSRQSEESLPEESRVPGRQATSPGVTVWLWGLGYTAASWPDWSFSCQAGFLVAAGAFKKPLQLIG